MHKNPLIRRNFYDILGISDDCSSSYRNTEYIDIFDEEQDLPKGSFDSVDFEEEDENDSSCNVEETKRKFWETQKQLLKDTLFKTSTTEAKIRQSTKEGLREIKERAYCVCGSAEAGGCCRKCLRRELSVWLQRKGFDCYICKSKWRSSQEIISGEHEYLEVLDRSKPKKEVRVIIEVNFRAEFEMARASDDYAELINPLPEVFVGKTERLKALIKILCGAAKKCMKEKKMHLGPWRKQKYMQSKWLGTYKRISAAEALPVGFSERPRKPQASMLTYDLLENLARVHYTVEVL